MLNEELLEYIIDLVMEKGESGHYETGHCWEYMDILYSVELSDKYLEFNDSCIYEKQDGGFKAYKATDDGFIDYSVGQVLLEIYNHIHKETP